MSHAYAQAADLVFCVYGAAIACPGADTAPTERKPEHHGIEHYLCLRCRAPGSPGQLMGTKQLSHVHGLLATFFGLVRAIITGTTYDTVGGLMWKYRRSVIPPM